MSNVTQGISSSITIVKSQNVLISNIDIFFANTEAAHPLQSGLKQLLIKNKHPKAVEIYFISGSSDVLTIPAGCTYFINEIDFSGIILYVKAKALPCTLEVQELY